jgi:hypothetical protein
MLRRFALGLSFGAMIVASACGGRSEEGRPSTTVVTAATMTAAPPAQGPVPGERWTARCPSTVPGAATVVTERDGAVELRVTADDGAAAQEIMRRSAALAGSAAATRGRHRGDGAVGGTFGRCPVVGRNTTVRASEIPKGALVTVVPEDAAELHWLRRETEARAGELEAPLDPGPGAMKDCPNAVAGSRTRVEDAPYGANVEIVSSSPGAALEIQRRAARVVLRAVSAAGSPRCPVGVPNVSYYYTPLEDGARLGVRAASPRDLPYVRNATRARAADFQPAPAR